MIYLRIMRNEISRKRVAMVVVFLFIFLSTLLVSGGISMIVELNGALDHLLRGARAPHVVQMHSGELRREAIEAWAESQRELEAFQIAEMITIDGSLLYLADSETPESRSVMDISFVRQNVHFDFLLGPDNEPAEIAPGGVGVPVYFARERGLAVGDLVSVRGEGFSREYTVAAIVRDAQMNPSIVHSKRFLLSDTDYTELRRKVGEIEYLIEFRLTDPQRTDEFIEAYQEAGLPNSGPAVDYQLFKLLNGVSDGIVSIVVILLSLLLMVIAILCLRFTILATVEEDYREIGVMKAIGMPKGNIRTIYLTKYLALGVVGTVLGYAASRPLHQLLTENIRSYAGSAPATASQLLIPLFGAGALLLMVLLAAVVVLRRFNRITAVEALQAGARREAPRGRWALPLRLAKPFDLNFYLGLRDAVLRLRLFGLQLFVFFFAAAVALVPINFLSTLKSPEFITYMGVGRSDIRIDLRQAEGGIAQLEEIVSRLDADRDVERYAPLVTSQCTLLRENGETETIAVETGNIALFPLEYLKGRAPEEKDEIALSYLNSKDLEKEIGDTIQLSQGGDLRDLTVVGIYQDITDGGRTAKALFSHDEESIVAISVSLDLRPGVATERKVEEYADAFHPARVTALESYLRQTLGNTMEQLVKVSNGALLLGLVISLLITSLFLRMLISKDARRIAIMKSVGFSNGDLRLQYLTTSLLLLGVGFGGGALFSNTLGEDLVSFFWSFLGAARIEFVIDPLLSYIVVPLLLMGTVAATTLATVREIKNHTVAATMAE